MSEYLPIKSPFPSTLTMVTADQKSTCTPSCRTGAICLNGRCVRPQTPPPPSASISEPVDEFVPEDFDDDLYANGNGNGSNFLLYGGIALALAAVAGGSYYYWFHVREQDDEE